jgi:hypothetical protein
MTAMTAAAGVRLGLKVWIAVGGPVFAVALGVMGWDVAHLKLQDAPHIDAQSSVVRAVAPKALLSPPWERSARPSYPIEATPFQASAFSYNAPYKDNPDIQAVAEASYTDDLFMRRPPAPVPRGHHRRR